jgi:hypothetical protein
VGFQDHVAAKENHDAAEFRAHDASRGPWTLRDLQHRHSGQPLRIHHRAGLAGKPRTRLTHWSTTSNIHDAKLLAGSEMLRDWFGIRNEFGSKDWYVLPREVPGISVFERKKAAGIFDGANYKGNGYWRFTFRGWIACFQA